LFRRSAAGAPGRSSLIVRAGYWMSMIQVSGGVVLGQLIGIIGFLCLTRLYLPAAFGAYASWLSVVLIGAVLCTGALETTLVRDGDGLARRDAAARVLWTALLGSVAFGCLSGLTLSVFPDVMPGNRLLVAASISIGVFALAASTVFQSWAVAEGLFYPSAFLRVTQSALVVAFPLALAFFGRSPGFLIWGHAFGLAATIAAWLAVFPSAALRPPALADLAAFWTARRRCLIYVLPALMIGSLAGNLPQLAVNWRFGAEMAGHLALAQRVLGLPLSLAGAAIGDVFRRYAAVAFRERGECIREFRSALASLAFVAAAFAAVMVPFGQSLFVFVFGETWRFAGQIADWMIPMYAIGIAASPLSYLVYIVQREDFDLLWQCVLLAVVAVTCLLFATLETTLSAYAMLYAAMYGVYILACSRFAHGVALSGPR
jgi:O-antigen/teichoic acid export membrane protein